MKFLDKLGDSACNILITVLAVLFIPFLLLYLLFELLITPARYIQYKRCAYHKDFPHKCSWPVVLHRDSEVYGIIKENQLPVEYIKWREDYDLPGSYFYNDVLLEFNEPLFFDKEKGLWLCWNHDENDPETAENDEIIDREENTDDCLTVEATTEYILSEVKSNIADLPCNRVVFFCERKFVVENYGEEALKVMEELDHFVVYEKGKLADAIKNFIART